jgi:O-antigen/teichoic acid export membrane protein
MSNPAEGRGRGLTYILFATAVAGVSGYAILLLAAAFLTEPEAYVTFTVFWSTLYLFVGAIGGVQQEVTRAVRPMPTAPKRSALVSFTLYSGLLLVAVSATVGVVLAPTAFSADPVGLTTWFGVGLIGYLGCAVLSGAMYGLRLWRPIAGLTIADAVIRGALVVMGLLLHFPPQVLAAFTAVPFTAALALVWLAVRRRVVGRFALDVDVKRLSVNALGTVAAAAATGVLVTGMPLLITLMMPGIPAALAASLIVVITITRAPLIIPLMALQSFLIVDFRSAHAAVLGRLVKYMALLVGVTVLASGVAYFIGPWLILTISSGRYDVDGAVVAWIVASAGLVALLCLTGPVLLSENRHTVYVAGWIIAAVVTLLGFLLPLEPVARTLTVLVAGPVAGLVVHLLGVRPRAEVASAVE